jgi:hypothetical protein
LAVALGPAEALATGSVATGSVSAVQATVEARDKRRSRVHISLKALLCAHPKAKPALEPSPGPEARCTPSW